MKPTTAFNILKKCSREYIKLKNLEFDANLYETGLADYQRAKNAYDERKKIETAIAELETFLKEESK